MNELVDQVGMFSLSQSGGVNKSEKALLELCNSSFLRLWSYSNPHRKRNKELIDILVVFGDDVILFSDRESVLQSDCNSVMWQRWCRKVIDESAEQLNRAAQWIRRYPTKIYSDKLAEIPLSIPTPSIERMRLHLIATGRADAFDSVENRSVENIQLRTDTGLAGWCPEERFVIGRVTTRTGNLVHVFSSAAIQLLLSELDTISDFTKYLRSREELFMSKVNVQACDERALLASYLYNRHPGYRGFLPYGQGFSKYDGAIFEDFLAQKYFGKEQHLDRISANKVSYLWDDIIDRFTQFGTQGLIPSSLIDAISLEPILRTMAAEDRLARRTLAARIIELKEKARKENIPAFSTAALHESAKEIAYIFCVFPNDPSIPRDQIRQARSHIMLAFGQKFLASRRKVKAVIVFTFDHPLTPVAQASEDILMISVGDITDEEAIKMEAAWNSLGISLEPSVEKHIRELEYPNSP